jgi:uncharacterized protein (TIRG00374 family)
MGQSLYIWFCDSLIIYFILTSIGATTPLSAGLFSAMISDLVAAVPITPGALGQFDATLIGLLALFDVTTTQGSLTVLLLRSVSLWTFIPVGAAITYIFGFSQALDLNGRKVDKSEGEATTATSLAELAEG